MTTLPRAGMPVGSVLRPSGKDLPEYWNIYVTVTICCAIGFVFMVLTLCRKLNYANRHRRPDGIYLQLATEKLLETIHLGECLLPLDQIFQKGKEQALITELEITKACGSCRAHVVWGRFLYATENLSEGKAIRLLLPGSFKLSKGMAETLINQYSITHLARLVRYYGGLASVIPLSVPSLGRAGWTAIGMEVIREELMDWPTRSTSTRLKTRGIMKSNKQERPSDQRPSTSKHKGIGESSSKQDQRLGLSKLGLHQIHESNETLYEQYSEAERLAEK